MPSAMSPEAEKLRAPTRSDAKLVLKEAGYRGGGQSVGLGDCTFSLDDVPGPDGRNAHVHVYNRSPSSPRIDAEYRARGGVLLPRELGLFLVVFVEKDKKPDATATAELLEKVSAGTGKTIPTVVMKPASKPSWKVKDILEERHVRSLLEFANFEVLEATARTPMDKLGNEYGRFALGKGKRGEDRISLHLECEIPGSHAPALSPLTEDAGGAMYVDGWCVAMVHVMLGSSEEADSEASQSALRDILRASVWRWPF